MIQKQDLEDKLKSIIAENTRWNHNPTYPYEYLIELLESHIEAINKLENQGKGDNMKCEKCHSHAVNIDPNQRLCDVCYYKIPLLNLLAMIHGGRYVPKHGLKKAIKDAKKILGRG